MKYIFNFYAQHLPFKIKDQIIELNNKLVKDLTPILIQNLNSYYKYLKDSRNQSEPNMLPLNVSSAGNKTLPSVTTRF